MSLIIAGTLRAPPENMDALRAQVSPLIAATRLEDGCEEYVFSEELGEPGLLRVFEIWRDQAALEAHMNTAHLKAWREAGAALGVSYGGFFAYELASRRKL